MIQILFQLNHLLREKMKEDNKETILSFNMWKNRKEYFSFQILRKMFRKQHFLFKKKSHFTWPTHESNKTSKTLNNKCIKVSKLSKQSNLNGSHKGCFGICWQFVLFWMVWKKLPYQSLQIILKAGHIGIIIPFKMVPEERRNIQLKRHLTHGSF